MPDACLMFFDEVLAFDHVRKQIQLIVTADLGSRQKPADAYKPTRSERSRGGWKSAWRRADSQDSEERQAARQTGHHQPYKVKKDYLAAVARIKEYIAAGDVFSDRAFAAF